MCKIDQKALFKGRCQNETGYGFKEGKPCIMIKLNKIFNWNPEPFESLEDMPEDIPQTIKDAFQKNIDDGTPELVSTKAKSDPFKLISLRTNVSG